MKVSEGAQNMGRDHSLPTFIVGIGPLRDIDRLTQLGLCQISIFSQIADASVFIHIHHRR